MNSGYKHLKNSISSVGHRLPQVKRIDWVHGPLFVAMGTGFPYTSSCQLLVKTSAEQTN